MKTSGVDQFALRSLNIIAQLTTLHSGVPPKLSRISSSNYLLPYGLTCNARTFLALQGSDGVVAVVAAAVLSSGTVIRT